MSTAVDPSWTWPEASLGSLLQIKYGKGLPARLRQDGSVPVYGSNGVVGAHSAALTNGPTIVIGRKGSFGEVNYSDVPCWPIDTTYYIDDPGPFTFAYLYRLLGTLGLTELDQSTAIPSLNRDHVYAIKVSKPPIDEQLSIVERLDRIDHHRNTAATALGRTRQTVVNFRKAVLAAAASGSLTNAWREDHGLGDWEVVPAAEICAKVQSGGTPRSGFVEEPGVPFLKVYNIVNQEVDFAYRPQFVSDEVHRGVLKKSIAYPGDVIMNIVGPPLGKVAIVPDDYPEWNLNQAITIFRPGSDVLRGWLYLYLCSGSFMDDEDLVTRGSAGQSNISLTQCRNLLIPVPSVEEQSEIIRRVDALLNCATQAQAQAEHATKLLDRTGQAVLTRALRGGLPSEATG